MITCFTQPYLLLRNSRQMLCRHYQTDKYLALLVLHNNYYSKKSFAGNKTKKICKKAKVFVFFCLLHYLVSA